MDAKMVEAINDQLNFELYSGYIYYSMATYFDSLGLSGMRQWMISQTQEEMVHAHKMFLFLSERGERTEMKGIDAPPVTWDSPLAVFEHALEHEKIVTGRINKLMDMALELRDHQAASFLQWYVAEQTEEEASVGEVAAKLRLIGDSGNAVYMLDKELGARVFVPPVELAASLVGAAGA